MKETLYDALELFAREISDAEFAQLKTALVRYVVPDWDGPSSVGARITQDELEKAMSYLRTVSVKQLRQAKVAQERVFARLHTSKSSQRNYRYHLRRFTDWATQKGWLEIDSDGGAEAKLEQFRFFEKGVRRDSPRDYWKKVSLPFHKRREIYLPNDKISPTLRGQLDEFETYRLKTVKPVSVNNDLRFIRRYLGWLHEDKGYLLAELTLESAIPFVKMRYGEIDFAASEDPFFQVFMAERKALEEAESVARQVAENVEDYLGNCSKMSNEGACDLTSYLLTLAKWLYRYEARDDYSNIPVIRTLKNMRSKYSKAIGTVRSIRPYALQSKPWNELSKVLDLLKFKADRTTQSDGRTRRGRGRGESIMRLLVMTFFVAMPPRRSRVIAELSLGRTLRKGRVRESGFIPEEILELGEECRWCIVLDASDYKTGKVYGPQSWEVNNLQYSDGSRFYDYLDLWINEYRQMFEPDHNYLFVCFNRSPKGLEKGRPATTYTIGDIVKRSIMNALGVPVPPRALRKMFVSYIASRSDISEADLEAAARAMGHSRKMQMEVYDQVTSEARLATGMQLADRLWTENLAKENNE